MDGKTVKRVVQRSPQYEEFLKRHARRLGMSIEEFEVYFRDMVKRVSMRKKTP